MVAAQIDVQTIPSRALGYINISHILKHDDLTHLSTELIMSGKQLVWRDLVRSTAVASSIFY